MKTIWLVLMSIAVLVPGISRQSEFAHEPAPLGLISNELADLATGRETNVSPGTFSLFGNEALALDGGNVARRVMIVAMRWNVVAAFVLALVIPGLAFAAGVATAAGLFFVWHTLQKRPAKDDDALSLAAPAAEPERPIPPRVDAPPAELRNAEPRNVEPRPVELPSVEPTSVEPHLVAEVVKSLFVIHDSLYRGLVDGCDRTNFDTVEGEITRHGFEIIKPAEGDKLDNSTMITTRSVDCPSDDKVGRVAEVDFCGFQPDAGVGWDAVRQRVIQKCKVAVYRKSRAATKGTGG